MELATLKFSLCRGASVPRSCWPVSWSVEDYWLPDLGNQTKQSPQGHTSSKILIPGSPLTPQLLAPGAPLTPQLLAPGAPLTPLLYLSSVDLRSQPVSHPSVGFQFCNPGHILSFTHNTIVFSTRAGPTQFSGLISSFFMNILSPIKVFSFF